MSSIGGRKLLRSALFCPANNAKALAKTAALKPDAFIYDLEDAVISSAKLSARDKLLEFFAGTYSPSVSTIAVRVNCPQSTPWGVDDIKSYAGEKRLNTLVLPKVESVESIKAALAILKMHRPVEFEPVRIWAMVETARGVLHSEDIAAHPHVEALVFGSNDLTKDIRASHMADRSPLLFSMSKCILAARAYKKYVLDGVYNDLKDDVGFNISCKAGRSYGFDGRSLIHPDQISTANAAYSPSESEILAAQMVLTAWDLAISEGKSVAVVAGKMIEELHVAEARDIIQIAQLLSSN